MKPLLEVVAMDTPGANLCPLQSHAVDRLSHLHDAGPTPPLAILKPTLLSPHTYTLCTIQVQANDGIDTSGSSWSDAIVNIVPCVLEAIPQLICLGYSRHCTLCEGGNCPTDFPGYSKH
jgi:hypothetical protein